MTEVAEAFNDAGITLADGTPVGVDLRSIASGTGYQFIARGEDLPDAFTPSSQLWIEMAGEFQSMTEIRAQTVPNVAGIVMKNETADELRTTYGDLDGREPRRRRDRRRPRDGLHRPVRVEHRAQLPADRARLDRRGRRRPAHVARRGQRVRAVPAPGAVRGAHHAADARLGRERHRHARHLRDGVADVHQHRVVAVGLRVHPVRCAPRQPAVRRR